MILRRVEGAVVCIEQARHAELAGQLAQAWGNRRFAAPEPREALELAAARHDDGMTDFDRSPGLDARTGLPYTYLTMPREAHMRAWERGTSALAEVSPYAAVIVSLHRTELLERHRGPWWRGLRDRTNRAQLRWQARLRARLVEGLRADPAFAPFLTAEALERNRRLLRTWDRLSLNLCVPNLPSVVRGVPARDGAEDLSLHEADGMVVVSPWPFLTDRISVATWGKRLEGRFANEPELHAALATAPVEQLRFRLRQ